MLDPSLRQEQNHLLAALPKSVQAGIFPRLKLVELNLGEVLNEPGDIITSVYFPISCIISLLYLTANGSSAEISVVGCEGVSGVSVLMGSESTLSRKVVQSKGFAYQMDASEFKAEFNDQADVRLLTLRYIQALITQTAQTAVCNRHHHIEQQLCRWLLLSLDRLRNNQLNMTHELIANMLGVRREGVTEAARKLQERGIIRYCRGRITVLDRPGLEACSCECYAVVKRETDRLSLMPLQVAENVRQISKPSMYPEYSA